MCDSNKELRCDDNTKLLWLEYFLSPMTSAEIRTEFYLYTNELSSRQSIHYNNKPATISALGFKGSRDTKIIIHGFRSSSDERWVEEMMDAFKIRGDFNIILVDWRRGANFIFPMYTKASLNTPIVGNDVAKLIKVLPTNKSKVHIIGHSLGAHVASFASK